MIIKTYTDTHSHNGEEYQIKIENHNEPINKTQDKTFYCKVTISKPDEIVNEFGLEENVKEEFKDDSFADIKKNFKYFIQK